MQLGFLRSVTTRWRRNPQAVPLGCHRCPKLLRTCSSLPSNSSSGPSLSGLSTSEKGWGRRLFAHVIEEQVARTGNKPISASDLDQLNELCRLVLAETRITNLTSSKLDEDGIYATHFADAVTALPVLDAEAQMQQQRREGHGVLTHDGNFLLDGNHADREFDKDHADGSVQARTLKLVDVGTGAGFPGLVLAILRPEWSVTLVDSVEKKCAFHRKAMDVLGLSCGRVRTVGGRAELLGRDPTYRETFELAIARAVADLPVLCEYCLPLVQPGGLFLAQKMLDAPHRQEVLRARLAIEKMGGELEAVSVVDELPFTAAPDRERCLVAIRKSRATPERYPRRVGVPSKRPILSAGDHGWDGDGDGCE